MADNLYVVTIDGYFGYGASIYCLGVFDSRKKAEQAVEQCKCDMLQASLFDDLDYDEDDVPVLDENRFIITEVELNQKYPMSYQNDNAPYSVEFENSKLLGSYAE